VAKGSDDSNCGHTKKDPIHQAICASTAAGVTYVVAAGNAATDFQNTSPAAYNEVLTATAMDDTDGEPGSLTPPSPSGCAQHTGDDVFASFSNFATLPADQAHTVAAPGVCDLSTAKGGLYATSSGTSDASPAIAGAVALCIANGPCAGLTPAQIVQKVVADAQAYNTTNPGYGFQGDPIRPVAGKYYGYLIRAGDF
jgi:subtilisin